MNMICYSAQYMCNPLMATARLVNLAIRHTGDTTRPIARWTCKENLVTKNTATVSIAVLEHASTQYQVSAIRVVQWYLLIHIEKDGQVAISEPPYTFCSITLQCFDSNQPDWLHTTVHLIANRLK